MKTRDRLLVLLALLTALPTAAPAATALEGYWENTMGGRKTTHGQAWDLYRPGRDWKYPSSYFELKLRSNIGSKAELWGKLGARWDGCNNNAPQPSFYLYEGHLKYRWERNQKAAEVFLFSREYRYWVGNHLLNLVDGDQVKDGDNSQGIRAEAWTGPWNLIYAFSDFSSQDNLGSQPERTDDVHILRGTHRIGDGGSYLGGTYLRKTYGQADASYGEQHNEVSSVDFQWVLPFADLSAEYAESRVPAEEIANDGWRAHDWHSAHIGKALENSVPRDGALRAELRNMVFGNSSLGYYTVNTGYWWVGPDFRNYMGKVDTDRVGHFFHTYYRLPTHAITYTLSWGNERRVNPYFYGLDFDLNPLMTSDPKRWLEQNLYIEFINGFRMSLSHNRSDEIYQGVEWPHHDWLAELIVENRLAWLKTQFKIKDWETRYEKRIYGLEATINLTQQWKWYNRLLVASDQTEARSMVYTQIQWRPHDNMELFLSYGPEEYGDWGALTNDADFESGGKMRDEFKLTLKTWF